jgi:sugar fermentation stimulation protein A
MQFNPPLQKAQLLKRYKRFLVDVRFADGDMVTVYCPNTGSMRNCIVEGSACWLSASDNPARKYRYTWELATTLDNGFACINTLRATTLVREAIEGDLVKELRNYANLESEVKYGKEGSRIDFLLKNRNDGDRRVCYVEVKSVTLLESKGGNKKESKNRGYFPDAISTRAAKHLRELMHIVQQGDRAVLFFCVQHSKIKSVSPADHIDAKYGELLRAAIDTGVVVVAYKAKISSRELVLVEAIPVVND